MENINEEINKEKKMMLRDFVATDLAKEKFIENIKSGLGEKIKKQPKKINKIKKGKLKRFREWFLGVFDKITKLI
jgi:hypothetical protein